MDGKDHNKYLWVNAAYAFGDRLTEAFALYGWFAAIRGVEGGGLVEGLPTHTFKTDDGDIALKCPTEIAITDRREKEFADLGFISLVHCKNTDYAAFFGGQSAQKAKKYDTDVANANARLSTQLPYIFAVSRFAHYLKAIMRDKIGSFASRARRRDLPQHLDLELRHARRLGLPGGQGAVPAARGAHRSGRGAGQARRLQGDRLPAAALPARRTDRLPAAGGGAAAFDEEVRDGNAADPGRSLARATPPRVGRPPRRRTMARIDEEIRINLSVLDRLVDFEPDVKTEPPASRSKALRQLKQALKRDLEWLLNTRRRSRCPRSCRSGRLPPRVRPSRTSRP